MNSSRPTNHSSALTLWVVNLPDREVRCVIDAKGAESQLRGTAHMLVDGTTTERRRFAGIDDLLELSADWRHRLMPRAGGWQ